VTLRFAQRKRLVPPLKTGVLLGWGLGRERCDRGAYLGAVKTKIMISDITLDHLPLISGDSGG